MRYRKRLLSLKLLIIATMLLGWSFLQAQAGSNYLDRNLINYGSVQADSQVTFLSRWPYGSAQHVKIKDRTAYYAVDNTLIAMDISDPAIPTVVKMDTFPGNWTTCLRIEGNLIFHAIASYGLQIRDIGNSADPVLLGEYQSTNTINDVAVYNDYAYLVSANFVDIIDFSDPAEPAQVGQITIVSGITAAIDDTIMHVSEGFSGNRIFSISNPVEPVELGSYLLSWSVNGIELRSGLAYISAGNGGFIVVDASNPQNATEIGSITSWTASGVSINQDYAYVHENSAGVNVIDISDPSGPVEVGSYSPGQNLAGELDYDDGLVAFSAGPRGLILINVSDPQSPVETSVVPSGGGTSNAQDIATSGDHIFVADNLDGLRILDISNPALPQHESRLVVEGQSLNRIFIENDIAYAAGGVFATFNIGNPTAPTLLGSVNKLQSATDIAYHNGSAYVSYQFDSLYVFDVSVPVEPIQIGSIELTSQETEFTISGNYLYLTADGGRIFDISDPANTIEVGQIGEPGKFWAASAIENGYLYLARKDTLEVFTLADPLIPTRVAVLPIDDFVARDLIVAGNYIVTIQTRDRMNIINVENPELPRLHAFTDIPNGNRLQSAAVADNRVYAAGGSNGIYIFQLDFPTGIDGATEIPIASFVLEQNYPNPFNPSTTIRLELPKNDHVRIDIFNVIGQKVATLIEGKLSAGSHKLVWNGKDHAGLPVATGQYFYRMSTRGYSITKSMTLIK